MRLKEMVLAYPGTYEVTDSFREGKREIRLKLKPAAATLGISVADLARQVRRSFYGAEAQRIVRGREEVKVMVRYPEETRRSLGTLEDMRIRTPQGAEIPISAVAELVLLPGACGDKPGRPAKGSDHKRQGKQGYIQRGRGGGLPQQGRPSGPGV